MATSDEVKQALLAAVTAAVKRDWASGALMYAEAYAWLDRPDQAHGGASPGH